MTATAWWKRVSGNIGSAPWVILCDWAYINSPGPLVCESCFLGLRDCSESCSDSSPPEMGKELPPESPPPPPHTHTHPPLPPKERKKKKVWGGGVSAKTCPWKLRKNILWQQLAHESQWKNPAARPRPYPPKCLEENNNIVAIVLWQEMLWGRSLLWGDHLLWSLNRGA